MHKSLEHALIDLESQGQLLRIKEEVDPYLEMAEIHRQVFLKEGPALLFENVKGSPFRACSNLFGTKERTEYLFRKTTPIVKKLIGERNKPQKLLSNPLKYPALIKAGFNSLPLPSISKESEWGETTIDQLPQIQCWPNDGGAFVLLPQVYCEDVDKPGWFKSNMGMYRIQLSGNDYTNDEIGLHYQLHRGIGVLHQKAIKANKPFKVSVFVGGPPAHAFAAVMPLPEGMPELTFAGMLAGRNFTYSRPDGFMVSSQADFCIVGEVIPDQLKPEGPFGDHLGYYSLKHNYPVLKVHKVYHRKNAIWPFTVVHRPPAEDSWFGWFVHELTGNAIQDELPGVKAVHAVDVAGVHPLLLAVGSERYTPYTKTERPMEILTQANAILGFGQCSLAKYLMIIQEQPEVDIHDLTGFLKEVLKRLDPNRDLHFITKTTMDTLDYTSGKFNEGSKLIMAAAGLAKFELASSYQYESSSKITNAKLYTEGVVVFETDKDNDVSRDDVRMWVNSQSKSSIRMWVQVDSIDKIETEDDFFWNVFTKSDPAKDLFGTNESIEDKHWMCDQIIIDATSKPYHAPELVQNEDVIVKVKELLNKILK